MFTLCGGHISPILSASEKLGIRIIDVRHEATAVFAADAVARLSGTIGVAVVTAGPGLTNTITALKNAQIAESPVLLLSGAAPALTKGRGALQDIDQFSLVKSICKYVGRAHSLRSIVPTLQKAIQIATSGTPGPVMVEFPIDVLYPYKIVEEASKRPLIVVGSQTILTPVPAIETAENIKKIGLPIYMTGMARGLLGRRHQLGFRHARKEALKEADLIILAGVVCDFRLDYGRSLSSRAKIISINRSSTQGSLNSDLFWRPTLIVNADVGTTLKLLQTAMINSPFKCDQSWIETLNTREDKRDKEIRAKSESKKALVHNNPIHILNLLEEHGLTDDSILVVDGGDFVGTASYILRPRGPLSWLDPGAFGTLGVGGGFAIGAKVCRPKQKLQMKSVLLILVLCQLFFKSNARISCLISGPLESCPGELVTSFRQLLQSSQSNLNDCLIFAREMKKNKTSLKLNSTADKRIQLAFEQWENEAEFLMASYNAKDILAKTIDPAQVLLIIDENRDEVICQMSLEHQKEFKNLVETLQIISNNTRIRQNCRLPQFPFQIVSGCPSIQNIGPIMCIHPPRPDLKIQEFPAIMSLVTYFDQKKEESKGAKNVRIVDVRKINV
ncbi:hypothetical protein Ciccas_004686 [Cichlidogyrus casuarinus]|uniref:IlvB-like protein n=1 Tax=Cichlidogyrus casuarinus TaxID=1844966 RepID=A0ABD2QAW0_9PLAT